MGVPLDRAIAFAIANPQVALVEISRVECERSLAEFTRQAWHVIEPGVPLIWNWHLDVLCAYVQAFYDGRLKRLIINVPPGTLKSIIFSVMGPAWMWTRDPAQRMIGFSAGLDIAKRDNRRTRDVVTSDWYRARWGERVSLVGDQDTTTHFETTRRGFRQALGLGANITGRRANKLGIDDPIDAKKAFSDVEIASVNTTVDQVIGSRLNDLATDGIGLIMQRLRTNDLTGHLLARTQGQWTHVCIPMEYDGRQGYDPVRDLGPAYAHLADPRREIGELLFPTKFPRRALAELREPLGDYGWAGQYQQRPAPLSGGILKSAWWRIWPDDQKLPTILTAFASYDTAFTTRDLKDRAYSAITVWGVWRDERDTTESEPQGRCKLLLLSAWWARVDMDDLLKQSQTIEAKKLKHPGDAHLIERKASGQSLIQMMRRRSRVRVIAYDPAQDGGGDKDARAYYAAPLLKAGLVWAPNRPWAQEIIRMIGEYPACDALGKDLTDTFTQALNCLKNGWWLHHPDDDVDWQAEIEGASRRAFDQAPVDEDDAPSRVGGGGYG